MDISRYHSPVAAFPVVQSLLTTSTILADIDDDSSMISHSMETTTDFSWYSL